MCDCIKCSECNHRVSICKKCEKNENAILFAQGILTGMCMCTAIIIMQLYKRA